ncbi:hypothetical protein [Elizabethkingia anophelis]|uniref:hypothetical protein n=1 Tax=Elizabethkingia anophelis TaxID=1117645 RepID=UPI0013708D96|nr:hypothetical protein [Elizabethkingia anophelis]MYY27408.1 hypothetical protein [Elizabethkingia anophelis]
MNQKERLKCIKREYIAPQIFLEKIKMEQGIASGSVSFSPPGINPRFGGSNKYIEKIEVMSKSKIGNG